MNQNTRDNGKPKHITLGEHNRQQFAKLANAPKKELSREVNDWLNKDKK